MSAPTLDLLAFGLLCLDICALTLALMYVAFSEG